MNERFVLGDWPVGEAVLFGQFKDSKVLTIWEAWAAPTEGSQLSDHTVPKFPKSITCDDIFEIKLTYANITISRIKLI